MPHILIVDSDFATAQVTRAIFARATPSAVVSIESDFAAAWRSIQSQMPDVLIVDPGIHCPEGLRLVRDLKKQQPHAYVIVLASAPTPALRREMERLGVDAYLEKPALLPLEIQHLLTTL